MTASVTLDPEFIAWTPTDWPEAASFAAQMTGWLFRGQGGTHWGLTTSLERLANSCGCELNSLCGKESEILDRFKRQARHYLPDPPADDCSLEWLSIIQHHGGPTRLLDFTRSFYVAAFFALAAVDEDSTIWAINELALNRRFADAADVDPQDHRQLRFEKRKRECADACINLAFDPPPLLSTVEGEHDLDFVFNRPNIIADHP